MDKKSLLDIDFQPFADVANNLIDKLANGIGWIAVPRGKKAQELEAQTYLIEQIKNDLQMPAMAKAASISNVKKIIRQYSNQNDIVEMAIGYLSETAKPSGVSEEWLAYFMDACKDIDGEDIKQVWAQILAGECNNNGSITKRLLNILKMMTKEEAEAFNRIIRFCVKTSAGQPILILYGLPLDEIYTDCGLSYNDCIKLEAAGLVQISFPGAYTIDGKGVNLTYFGREINVNSIEGEIEVGYAKLTDEGEQLAQIVVVECVDGFWEFVMKYLNQ